MKIPLLSNESLMRLFRYLPPYKWWIVGAAIAMIIGGLSSSMIATFIGRLTDAGFYDKDPNVIYWAPVALIAITLMYSGSQYISQVLLVRVSQSVLITLRTQMFDRILQWPNSLCQEQRCARVQAKFINEAGTALGSAASVMTTIIRDVIQIIGLLAVMIYHNWLLTLLTFVVGPFLIVLLRWINKRIKKFTSKMQDTFGVLVGVLQEAYEGQRIVKIYDGYDYERNRFAKVNHELKDLLIRTQRVSAAGTPLTQLITQVATSLVLVFSLYQAQQGNLTIGEFTTFLSAMLLVLTPIRRLSGLNGTTAAMTAAAESIFQLLDAEIEKDPGTKVLENYQGAVRFDKVAFRYPNAEKDAVEEFTLDVRPGEKIALVGSSGSGKTSLINLIPRFWEPTRGEIYFDEVPASRLTLKSLRDQIALVSQDVTIFDDTIAGNIAYGCKDKVTPRQIQEAVKAAALRDFVNSLPEGLDTPVGSHGSMLSGGQRQRISIARAFLKNAPILLLDEATSALDTESERHIQEALDTLQEGRTSFVVAHRLSTIQNADRIVVMRDGQIVEIGTHQELLEKHGMYERLYNLQFQRQAKKEVEC